MPTIRYQIRNEYGLADPELHRAADKDDPEAILEGVAMAGLIGVLRQLGDLAEFAAEIFRDLHEEVMATAARGHGLMLRVQQLEAEVPSVEKAILSLSGHSNYAYNDGIDWHCNIHIDQSIITQGDMPRFVLDSYEECRGPPRLFTLDKFDTAGAGACLKRYTDPSFFKMNLVSSGLMETEIPREKKSRKTRKKGSRWKNGQTLESLFSPQANSNSQPTTSDQVAGKSATRLVRLKPRNLNEKSGDTGGSLRKCLLQLHSDYQKVAFDNSRSSSNVNPQPVDSSESTSEVHETFMDMSANYPLVTDVSPTMKPSNDSARLTTYELHDWMIEGEEFSGMHEPFAKGENPHKDINFVENKEMFTDSENNSEGSAYDNELSNIVKTTSLPVVDHKFVGVELKLEVSTDGYRTEDIGSEQENFMDALNSMESEVEMDSENKGGSDIDILGKKTHKMNVHTSGTPDGTEVSSVSVGLNNVCKIGISNNLSNSAETPATQEKAVASDSSNSEFCLNQTDDENCEELLPNDEVAWLTDCISDGASNTMTLDNPTLGSQEIRKEHCSSSDASSTSDLTKSSPCKGFEALQSVTYNKPANHEAQLGSDQTVKFSDGSPYPHQCFPEKTHPEEDVEEDRTTMPEMFHHLSCSPNRTLLTEDTDCEDLLCTTMPIVEEMQDLVDQETNAFSLKEDTTSSCKGSISTAISDIAPAVRMDDIQHDEIATDTSNCQYLKESTIETSSDYVKRIDDIAVAQSVNGPDQHIPEKPDFACNTAELILGEMTLNHDLSDHLSKTNDESTLVGNFAHDIAVPSHPSNVTIGKPLESMNRYAEVCPTETASPAVPVISAIGADCTAELEDTVVENLDVGFENADDGAKSDLEMSKILQPLLEYYSDTEESQESPKVNSVEELQESSKVNFAELLPLHPESGTFPDRTTNSAMFVDDNFKMSKEFIQDSPHGNVQGLKNLKPENFASEDETNYSDLSMVNTQDATGHQLRLSEDSTDIPYQYRLNTHETCSSQTMEACQGLEESSPEPAETCLECPVQYFDSKCVAQGENLTAENFASKDETNYSDLALVYTQDAAGHGLQLLEDNTDVPYQYQLKTHETCSLRTMQAVDSQSTLTEEVCPGVEESTPEPAQMCLECPVQVSDSKCLAQVDHENAKQEMSLSTNLNSIPASLPEEFSTSQASNEVKVELESLDQMAESPEPAVPSNSMDLHDKPSEGVEPNCHGPLSNLEYDELNISTPNAGEIIQLHSEALVLSECSSEISACHVAYNISGLTFPSMSSSDISVVESASRMLDHPHSDEATSCFPSQNSEEPPPLPPLPPLGWRSRKLHLNSLLPDENSFQSLAGANPFMTPSGNKTANPFLAPPIVVDQSHQLDSLSFSGNNLDSSKVPSLTSSSLEHEKSLYAPAAEEELTLPLADSFTPSSLSESQISQHSTMHEERIQSVPNRLHNQLWPGLELEKSHYSEHSRLSFEKEMAQSQNPFLVQSTMEDENRHHNYGDFRGENMHLMKPMELSLSSGLEMPQPGFFYSLEGSQHTTFGVGLTKEDKWFGIRPRSIRNRPRNPLMEAVVAHDRSTLRKVSEIGKPDNESKADRKEALLQSNILQLRKVPELVKPSNNPKAEGTDALLEQIRNKSISLKPAVVSKPSNKSHSTNVTVAAIVEKANALRQAMAGSDEEDAGDSWSDC